MVIPLLAWSKQCEVIVPTPIKFTVLMLGIGGPPCGDCITKKRKISTQVFGLGRWPVFSSHISMWVSHMSQGIGYIVTLWGEGMQLTIMPCIERLLNLNHIMTLYDVI